MVKKRRIRAYGWEHPWGDKIDECRDSPPNLEKQLHEFLNKHLKDLFGVDLIKSEYKQKPGSRLDALAFDNKRKCFVILEYKTDNLNRLAWQLLRYIKKDSEYVMEYSKAQEKYPDIFTTLIHDIQDGYIIVVATNFQDDEIEDLSNIGEIHMYEIHPFDNSFVLYKVDDYDWPKSHVAPSEPGSAYNTAALPILKLNGDKINDTNPAALYFPDGSLVNISEWTKIMAKVAKWLYNNGHITSSNQSDILKMQPPTKYNGEIYRNIQLADDIFINANYSRVQILKRIQKLLNDIGYRPQDFAVILEPKT